MYPFDMVKTIMFLILISIDCRIYAYLLTLIIVQEWEYAAVYAIDAYLVTVFTVDMYYEWYKDE